MPFDKDFDVGKPIKRTRKDRKKADPEQIKLSEQEQQVLQHLKSFHWPKGSFQLLPAAVRTSMRNYNRFLKRFQEVLKESKKRAPDGQIKKGSHYEYSTLDEFIQHHLADTFLPAPAYITCWFERLNHKILHWKGWNGKVRPFTITSEDFQNEGADIATEWAGNSGGKIWKKFMEKIDEGQKG